MQSSKIEVNKSKNMLKYLILILTFYLYFTCVEASENKAYEMPRTQVVPIKNTGTSAQYELYIKLPEGYAENSKNTYPVIYFTDAVWHIEVLSAATEYLMENAILVGISWQKDINEDLKKDDGAHVSRFRDYSVTNISSVEKQAKYQFGQAANHLSFIRNDVIKHIEKNYRTTPDNRSYFGYSLGGLFGAYILMAQPDTFKNYIIGSPSLWKDTPYLTKLEAKNALIRKNLNANVFISHGSLEEKLSVHIKEFVTVLKARNDQSLLLQREVIEGSHQTAFPMTSVRGVAWLSSLITPTEGKE